MLLVVFRKFFEFVVILVLTAGRANTFTPSRDTFTRRQHVFVLGNLALVSPRTLRRRHHIGHHLPLVGRMEDVLQIIVVDYHFNGVLSPERKVRVGRFGEATATANQPRPQPLVIGGLTGVVGSLQKVIKSLHCSVFVITS